MSIFKRVSFASHAPKLLSLALLLVLALTPLACGSDTNDTGSAGTTDTGNGATTDTSGSTETCNTANEDASPDNRSAVEEAKEEEMYPGADCLSCHVAGGPGAEGEEGEEGRIFTAAGTVFQDRDGSAPASGVTIVITDADGGVIEMTSNGAGNFFTEQDIAFPASVVARKGDQELVMGTPLTEGGCNTCHSCGDDAGGKVFAP